MPRPPGLRNYTSPCVQASRRPEDGRHRSLDRVPPPAASSSSSSPLPDRDRRSEDAARDRSPRRPGRWTNHDGRGRVRPVPSTYRTVSGMVDDKYRPALSKHPRCIRCAYVRQNRDALGEGPSRGRDPGQDVEDEASLPLWTDVSCESRRARRLSRPTKCLSAPSLRGADGRPLR